MEPLSIEPHSIRIGDLLVGANVQQDLVRQPILRGEVVDVVRRYKGKIEGAAKPDHVLMQALVPLCSVILKL